MMTFKQLRQITDVHEEAKFSIRLIELTTCDDGTQDIQNDFCDDLDKYDDYIVLHLHCNRFGNRIVIVNPNKVK